MRHPTQALRHTSCLAALLLGLLACGCRPGPAPPAAAAEPSAAAGAPDPADLSFLLITLDTTRADHLEPYGAGGAETPSLRALAQQGVLFEHAYATTPVTLPSHASILTGLYPPRHGVRDNGIHYLDEGHATLAEILAGQGLRTAAFVSAAVLDRRFGLGRGFATYDDDLRAGRPREPRMNAERGAGATVDAARTWLDGLGAGERYFLWVHLFDPHATYTPPEPWAQRFRDRPYAGEIAYMDAELGRLLAHPRSARQKTLTMVIADHGESLGEHGEDTHAMLAYDATLRIPWLVRLPGSGGGHRVGRPVSQVDVLPTALELLGLGEHAAGLDLDGVSQAAAIRGTVDSAPPADDGRVLYAETLVPWTTYGWAPLRSVRRGRLKLIEAPTPELYDLEADPGERINLHAERPRDADALSRALVELAGAEATVAAAARPLPSDTRRRLESLGYVTGSGAQKRRHPPDPKQVIDLHLTIERATELLYRQDPAAAVAELRRAVARDRDNLAALRNLARGLAALGRFDEAVRVARRALALAPESPDLHTSAGVIEAARGERSRALELFDAALTLDPRWIDARVEKALVLAQLGRLDEAAELMRGVLAEDPDEARAQVGVAELAELPAGELAAAEQRLRRVSARDPFLSEAWLALGRVLDAAGRPRDAEGTYREGLTKLPDDARLHGHLGALLARAGADDAALRHLARARQLSPAGLPAVHSAKAAIHLRRREWGAAEAEARLLLELTPEHGTGWNQLAVALEEQGRVEAALAAFDRGRAADPGHWRGRFNRALLLRKLERWPEAAAAFSEVLQQVPEHAGSHYELGLLHAGPLADPRRARSHLRACLEAEPDHPRAAQVRQVLQDLPP